MNTIPLILDQNTSVPMWSPGQVHRNPPQDQRKEERGLAERGWRPEVLFISLYVGNGMVVIIQQ